MSSSLRLHGEGLVWLIGAVVCLCVASWVQLLDSRYKMFDGIKAQAVAAGKQVSNRDDVLCVNVTDVFSLRQRVIRESTAGVIATPNVH